MTTWYVLDASGAAQTTLGPLSLEQLAELVVDGRLTPTTLVARVGAAQWTEAAADAGLAPLFGAKPKAPSWSPSGSAAIAFGAIGSQDAADGRRGLDSTTGSGPSPANYSFAAALSAAAHAFKTRWGVLTMVGLILTAVSIATAVPGALTKMLGAMSGDPNVAVAMAGIGDALVSLLALLINGPLLVGVIICGANAVAGRGEVGEVMLGFKRYPQVLGTSLLTAAIVAVASVACVVGGIVTGAATWGLAGLFNDAAASEAGAWVGVATAGVLFIAVTVLVCMRLVFAAVIAADPQLESIAPMAALRRSWQMAQGLGWSMLALLLVASMAAAASLLLLGVGYFVIGLPLLVAIHGAMYAMIARSGTPPMDEERARRISLGTIWGTAAVILAMVLTAVVLAAASRGGDSPGEREWQPSLDSVWPNDPVAGAPAAEALVLPELTEPISAFTATYRAAQAGAHIRQWTLTLDPDSEYGFMASSEDEHDIDLRIRQRGTLLDEDTTLDHIPLVGVSGVSGEVTLELILPSSIRRGDVIVLAGERSPSGAGNAARPDPDAGEVDLGRVVAERNYQAARAGAHYVDFTFTVSRDASYTFFASSRRETDVDLYLYLDEVLIDVDILEDHYPMVEASGIGGDVMLRLEFPSGTRVGDEVTIVIRQR